MEKKLYLYKTSRRIKRLDVNVEKDAEYFSIRKAFASETSRVPGLFIWGMEFPIRVSLINGFIEAIRVFMDEDGHIIVDGNLHIQLPSELKIDIRHVRLVFERDSMDRFIKNQEDLECLKRVDSYTIYTPYKQCNCEPAFAGSFFIFQFFEVLPLYKILVD